MRKSAFWSLACAAIALPLLFSSCDEGGETYQEEVTGDVFILNQGSWGMNNADITLYNSQTGQSVPRYFSRQNGLMLGDTGQDMLLYEDYIYIVMNESCKLVKMNKDGKQVAEVTFTAEEGLPRCAAAANGNIYVTLYSNNVIKLDANTLERKGMLPVGLNPEGIVAYDGFLYVANGGWGADSTLSVISMDDFTEVKKVVVSKNPDAVVVAQGKIFVQSYGEFYDYPVDMYDPETGAVARIGRASKMEAHDGTLYMVYGETNWETNETVNTFSTYDVATQTLTEGEFLYGASDHLAAQTIGMIEVNEKNGEIYIGTTDYVTNGTIYRFDAEKHLVSSFDCGGINPWRMVFK